MKVITTATTTHGHVQQFVSTYQGLSYDVVSDKVAALLRLADAGFSNGVHFCLHIDDDEHGQVVLNGQSLSSFAMRIVDE